MRGVWIGLMGLAVGVALAKLTLEAGGETEGEPPALCRVEGVLRPSADLENNACETP